MKTQLFPANSLCGCLAILSLSMLSGCSGFPEADISVVSLEVTQGLQNSSNSLTMIAQRGTAVRALLSTDGVAEVGPIGGSLTVWVDGTEITPPGGLAPINTPFNAVETPDRNSEDHTLNFELPSPSGVTGGNVDFEVSVDYIEDPDNTNNTFRVDDLSFVEIENPDLIFVRVDFTPSGQGLPDLSTVEAGNGDAMVKGIYPVGDNDPDLYEPASVPTLVYSSDPNGNGLLDLAEADALQSVLAVSRDLMVNFDFRDMYTTYLYGWVPLDAFSDFGGQAPIPGYSAFGHDSETHHQRSYAHELGHNFGLLDYSTSRILDPDIGWDVGARLESNPVGNSTTGRVKPDSLNDIMAQGPQTSLTWVNASTYTYVATHLQVLSDIPVAAAKVTAPSAGVGAEGVESSSVMVVHGSFNAEGTELLQLNPTLRLEGPARVPNKQENGVFTAVITDNNGRKHEFPFDARVCYEGGEGIRHGFFEVLMPLLPTSRIQQLDILKTETHQRMGGWTASQKPSVTLIAPRPGESLGEDTTVKWNASDPDTSLNDMLFHIAYSPDGGSTWAPVGANLKGRSYTFNSRQIPQADEDAGMLKIYASDGLNTVTDQVEELNTLATNQ